MSESSDNLAGLSSRGLRFAIGGPVRWLSSYKRPLFAIIVVLTTLGSVALYAYFIETLPPIPRPENILQSATGEFDVEITLTFDAKADSAFVIKPTSVLVRLADVDLIQSDQTFTAGRAVLIENVPNVKVGANEFWLEVHAGDAANETRDAFSLGFDEPKGENDFAVARAVRVRIRRDGLPIAEQTLWSEPGEPVEGKVLVTVPDAVPHGHEH